MHMAIPENSMLIVTLVGKESGKPWSKESSVPVGISGPRRGCVPSLALGQLEAGGSTGAVLFGLCSFLPSFPG